MKVVQTLLDNRGITLDHLVHDKYRLRQAVAQKIDSHRQAARKQAFQTFFLDPTPLEVTPELCFTYDPHRYPSRLYQGGYKFQKHYYPEPGEFDNNEELECAAFLDSLPEIKTWVRNPARGSRAFWLQTSTDKFYPDFVCQLTDGRFLVVEYKGDRWDDKENVEKREIGALWEWQSKGLCLFIMPKGKDFVAIRRKVE